jgi:hypothetical protein
MGPEHHPYRHRAFITGSSVLSDDLTVEADNSGEILGISASLSGGGNVGVAGSVSVNHIDGSARAYVNDSSVTISAGAGAASLSASNASIIHSVAGSPSFGGKAGIGASVAVNTLNNTTEAYATDSDIVSPNAVSLTADTASEILAASAAIGASRGPIAAAVAVSVNTITDRTQASVSGKQVSGIQAGGDIAIEAEDKSTIVSLSGSIAGTSGTAGVGISTAVNVVNNSVEAAVLGDARVESTGGDVRVTAAASRPSPAATVAAALDSSACR